MGRTAWELAVEAVSQVSFGVSLGGILALPSGVLLDKKGPRSLHLHLRNVNPDISLQALNGN